jgi:hypothetical protein
MLLDIHSVPLVSSVVVSRASVIRRCCAPISGAPFGITYEMSIAALCYRCNGNASFRNRSGILAASSDHRSTFAAQRSPQLQEILKVTLDDERRVTATAEWQAKELGQPMNIAVADSGGGLPARASAPSGAHRCPGLFLRSDKASGSDHYIVVRSGGPPGRRIILYDYLASRTTAGLKFSGQDAAIRNQLREPSSRNPRPLDQIDLTSPPSILSVDPVIHRAPGDTRNAISSAISSGSP